VNGTGVVGFLEDFDRGDHAMVSFDDMINAPPVSHTPDSAAWLLISIGTVTHLGLNGIDECRVA
jgi:hypothetical protein